MEQRPIGFIHIPKTAGTSLNSALARYSGQASRFTTVYDFANFGDYLKDRPAIWGHIPFFFFDSEGTDRRLFTLLRDPEQRVISNYKYILTSGHYARDYVIDRGLSLGQCFDHPIIRIELSNFQTKMLGWSASRELTWPASEPQAHAAFLSEYHAFLFGRATDGTLAAAIERLVNRVAFALIDDAASVLDLCRGLTGQDVEIPRVNETAPTDYEVTSHDLDAINRNNELDLALVNFARARLDTIRHARRVVQNG